MMWAVTTYFNPTYSRHRLRNYRVFRQHLTVPLVAIELAPDGCFDLGPDDADILVRVEGGDVLWQKERLLNLAIARVPASCRQIAWLDADVVSGADDWAERTSEALRQWPLVQLFDTVYRLPRNAWPLERTDHDAAQADRSVAWKIATGAMTSANFREDASRVSGTSWGMAWAARRDLLERHGFYDACIVGGGDEALCCAAVGGFERARRTIRMHERRFQHYLRWARPFHRDVNGRIGWVSGSLFHLWHGEPAGRRYRERHEDMERFHFDPDADIRLTEHGAWRWSSDKPDLHAYLANYFRTRCETEDDQPRPRDLLSESRGGTTIS